MKHLKQKSLKRLKNLKHSVAGGHDLPCGELQLPASSGQGGVSPEYTSIAGCQPVAPPAVRSQSPSNVWSWETMGHSAPVMGVCGAVGEGHGVAGDGRAVWEGGAAGAEGGGHMRVG